MTNPTTPPPLPTVRRPDGREAYPAEFVQALAHRFSMRPNATTDRLKYRLDGAGQILLFGLDEEATGTTTKATKQAFTRIGKLAGKLRDEIEALDDQAQATFWRSDDEIRASLAHLPETGLHETRFGNTISCVPLGDGSTLTTYMDERLNWRALTKAEELLVHKVEAIENLHGHEYDRIKKQVKDGELIVTGEKTVAERAEGLGGTFTYCTLGDPVELDKVLSGETLPPYAGLGAALFHMATNRALDPTAVREDDFYLGATEGQHVWLIYKPDLEWLKTPEAALTLSRAKAFAATDADKRHLVFAPARYVSQKMLDEQNIPVEFVPLPFALYRIDRS